MLDLAGMSLAEIRASEQRWNANRRVSNLASCLMQVARIRLADYHANRQIDAYLGVNRDHAGRLLP